ncbi:hypothetical protein [Marinobacterium marinum]|uniref:Uncharacterized protein n=1 Tax=Marinobacterium marinum TaxID=2756129 RepID=A0A7W1WXM1_9GAMM|nr:hypothetical protein [Marinobacterium marinum]MBA4501994.1 hypothetical protein [Marinobacterium marinum]
MKSFLKFLIIAFIINISNMAYASQAISIEKSVAFSDLSKGYDITITDIHTDSKVYDFNTDKVEVENDSDIPFYRYLLKIEKSGKKWSKQVIFFKDVDNIVGLDALLFGQFLNTTDIDHLDQEYAYGFYVNLKNILSEDYFPFKQVFDKGLSDYLDYMEISGDFKGYIQRTESASERLNAALNEIKMPELPSHEDIIKRFIKSINEKSNDWLLGQQMPGSSDREKGIYSRGLGTLYKYFDTIGNPSEFKVIETRESPAYVKDPQTYYIIELLGHTGKREKIEMEFTFVDIYGYRYVGEYDITGIHFQ